MPGLEWPQSVGAAELVLSGAQSRVRSSSQLCRLNWLQLCRVLCAARFVHFVALGAYTVLHRVAAPPLKLLAGRLPPRQQYGLRRQLDSWRYGSGLDYTREG